MKAIKILILFSLTIMSCSDKNKKFNDIDFIAYTYREFDSKSKVYSKEWKVIPSMYIHIDNKYKCQLIYERIFDNPGIYYQGTDGKEPGLREIIDEIIDKSIGIPNDLDLRPKGLFLYDGSYLKIRIIHGDNSRVIHFWQWEDTSKVYEKLFFAKRCMIETMPHQLPTIL
ncbi:MAG: hypothetical protein IPJ37_17545 [Bacteroidales bacterium]|nr:hypothetical protein [Bacteroidales bacterium]